MHLRPIVARRACGFTAASLVALAGACSSSSTPATRLTAKDAAPDAVDSGHKTKGRDAAIADSSPGAADVHPDVIVDPADCVSVKATSSEKGVGGYCSPMAGQCLHAGPGGTATLCTADFGAPAHEWFCTIPCGTTADCGPGGGTCLSTPFAQICVPPSCTGGLGDASSLVIDAGDAGPVDGAVHHDGAAHDGASRDALPRDASGTADASKG